MKLLEFWRALTRREPPKVAANDATPAPRMGRAGLARAAARAEIDAPDTMPRFEFKFPELPPGVVPRELPAGAVLAHDESPFLANDNNASVLANFQYMNSGALSCGVGFPGYPYLAELTQLSEYRSPSETISTEMTRKWIKFNGGEGDKADKLKKIEAAFNEFKVQALFRQAVLIDGEFGLAHLFIGIKGQDNKRDMPFVISKDTIGVGCLDRLVVVEPYWTTPFSYNTIDPTKHDFYKPHSWFIMGQKTHQSRLLRFVAREVPDMLKPAYNFGGMSMTQLMQPYVNQWLRTRNSVSDLVHSFSTSVLATDMQATLQDGSDHDSLFNRVRLFNSMRDNRGLMVVNKDSEELVQVNTPLGTVDALQAQSQEHMCAPCHIPIVKLFGMTPSGLNSSSEDEIAVFYDYIHAMQELLFTDPLEKLLKIFQLHLFGEIDDDISAEFVPLHEMTTKEKSEIRKTDADAGIAYVTNGVISPDEERQRLMDDPDSGYDNLEGDAPGMPVDPNTIDPETGQPYAPPEGEEDEGPPKKEAA